MCGWSQGQNQLYLNNWIIVSMLGKPFSSVKEEMRGGRWKWQPWLGCLHWVSTGLSVVSYGPRWSPDKEISAIGTCWDRGKDLLSSTVYTLVSPPASDGSFTFRVTWMTLVKLFNSQSRNQNKTVNMGKEFMWKMVCVWHRCEGNERD